MSHPARRVGSLDFLDAHHAGRLLRDRRSPLGGGDRQTARHCRRTASLTRAILLSLPFSFLAVLPLEHRD